MQPNNPTAIAQYWRSGPNQSKTTSIMIPKSSAFNSHKNKVALGVQPPYCWGVYVLPQRAQQVHYQMLGRG